MSGAQWDVRLQDDASAERLERSGVPYLTALTLAARGVTEPEAAHAFLARGEAGEGFHDPFLLPDMDKAIRRIQAALQNHEKIAVYGDYDVDGVTAAVLLYEQLVSMGADCVWHIPNRLSDGHGLQEDALDALKANGVSLIVTVDTGVSAVREARYAAQLGLELILTDHHECPGTLPDALAIVNPKRPGSAYPFAELAGVGVAYKLARALSGDSGEDASLRRYGDLVALGTVADLAPLTDENRRFVQLGLERLAQTDRAGLRALMDEAECAGRVTAHTVAYKLAPRLNAAGRMDHAGAAVELLLCGDPNEGKRLALLLGELNLTRKSIEAEVFRQAACRAEAAGPDETRYALVLESEGWHEGVTGIAASQLADRYGVPAFLISLKEDSPFGKGSARGVPPDSRHGGRLKLTDALSACEDILENYGGHELAAGFRVRRENIPALRKALQSFCQTAAETGGADAGRAAPAFDAMADPPRVTLDAVRALESLEPFGAGNPEPTLVFENILLRGVEPLKNGAHTRLTLDAAGRVFTAVWFGMRPERLGVGRDDRVDAAFTPEINCFRDRESVQLHMRAIRPSQAQTALDTELWDAYTRFCAGAADIKPSHAFQLRPQRPHMGTVWRALTREGLLELEPISLARALGGDHTRRLPVGMVWVTLDVFAEAGLVVLRKEERWRVEAHARAEKADVEGSTVLAALDRLL